VRALPPTPSPPSSDGKPFKALVRIIEDFQLENGVSLSLKCFSRLITGGGGWGGTPNAFLFSLHNRQEGLVFKSMVGLPYGAIFSPIDYGPTFGTGYDIYISDNANTNGKSYTAFGQQYIVPGGIHGSRFDILPGTNSFTPDAIEVFYLGRLDSHRAYVKLLITQLSS